MDYQNIIFDLGNVFIDVDMGAPYQFLDELRQRPLRHTDSSPELQRLVRDYESGVIPDSLFFSAWAQLEGGEYTLRELKKAWIKVVKDPIFTNEEVVRDLKQKGISMAILSNTCPTHVEVFEKPAYPILRHFKHIYYSHEIGYVKPELHAFAYVLKDRDFEPKKTVFIDDRIENVQAAEQLGVKGIHLKTPLALRDELSQLGLLE